MLYTIKYNAFIDETEDIRMSLIKKFLLKLKKNIKINFFIRKKVLGNNFFSQQNYSFSFKPCKKKQYIFLLGVPKKQKQDFCIYNTYHNNYAPYLGKSYLPFLVYYNFIVYLLEKGCKNIILTDMMDDSDDVLINEKNDISIFFNMIELNTFYTFRKDKEFLEVCKKGSDIIQYLQKPYAEAVKMQGFPRSWKIPKEFYKT